MCTCVLYPLVPRCPRRSCTRVHVYPGFVPRLFPGVPSVTAIALLLHCSFAALPPCCPRSQAGPVRSQQRVRAVIGWQQVMGISAARCVFPIPFPCHCVHEFSLSPSPPAQVRFQKKLQDLFEMEPTRIRAHYRTCLASGTRKVCFFFDNLFCRVVRSVHVPSVSCSIPHRRLCRGGRCTGSLLWDPRRVPLQEGQGGSPAHLRGGVCALW